MTGRRYLIVEVGADSRISGTSAPAGHNVTATLPAAAAELTDRLTRMRRRFQVQLGEVPNLYLTETPARSDQVLYAGLSSRVCATGPPPDPSRSRYPEREVALTVLAGCLQGAIGNLDLRLARLRQVHDERPTAAAGAAGGTSTPAR